MTVRIAIVGDVHHRWTDDDTAWFSAGDQDLVVVIGDLAGFRFSGTRRIAERLSEVTRPLLLIPGNHDASHAVQLLGESIARPALGRPFVGVQSRNLTALHEAVAPHPIGAYSLHPVGDVTVVAGRPHSMGGPHLSFAPHLLATWGIDSLEASTERLKALVDAAPTEELLFVAHNGPAGLGATRTDIWGCDFRREEGDWGDPDLAAAIAHAKATGRRVRAVVGGHMHRRIRGGGEREARKTVDGTLYVNAAEVPRITDRGHHHVALTLTADTTTAEDRWIPAGATP
jgi:uncharacterized protein (TIGR04168 family)